MEIMATQLEDQPMAAPRDVDEGTIGMAGVVLSRVIYWVEDGVHVLRSTEFDISASDEDHQAAVEKFVANAEDLAYFYRDLDDPTVEELETALEILTRIHRAYTSQKKRDAIRRAQIRRLRGRRPGQVHRSSHRSSSVRSLA